MAKISEGEKAKAQAEYEKVIKWEIEESDKVTEQLKEEGKLSGILDGYQERYLYIRKERNRKIQEIKNKYGIE